MSNSLRLYSSSVDCRYRDLMELTLIIVCLAYNVHAQATRYLNVSTRSGKLRGFRETVLGHDVDIFLGVPFARPPVGELRFRRPQTSGPWSGTHDATRRPPSCYQAIDDAFDRFQVCATFPCTKGRIFLI